MKKRFKWNPLESRIYRYKNARNQFYCPLCTTERVIMTSPYLTWQNYLQITLLSGGISYLFYDVMKWRSFFIFFIIWAIFEFVRRSIYRKEVPCPHCGFDASWYKRDVRKAKSIVQEFWADNKQLKTQK